MNMDEFNNYVLNESFSIQNCTLDAERFVENVENSCNLEVLDEIFDEQYFNSTDLLLATQQVDEQHSQSIPNAIVGVTNDVTIDSTDDVTSETKEPLASDNVTESIHQSVNERFAFQPDAEYVGITSKRYVQI